MNRWDSFGGLPKLSRSCSEDAPELTRQQTIPLIHEGIKMEIGFRADLVIENKVIVEIKSIEALADIHYKQLLTYLKLTDIKLGMLINFNVLLIKDGIHRIVNKL